MQICCLWVCVQTVNLWTSVFYLIHRLCGLFNSVRIRVTKVIHVDVYMLWEVYKNLASLMNHFLPELNET